MHVFINVLKIIKILFYKFIWESLKVEKEIKLKIRVCKRIKEHENMVETMIKYIKI